MAKKVSKKRTTKKKSVSKKKKTTAKKTTKKKAPKKVVSKKKTTKKKVSKKQPKEEDTEEAINKRYRVLINKIRRSKSSQIEGDAFSDILDIISPKIKKMVSSFMAKGGIPGLGYDDIYQEALFALRYKAIKDYDQTRGRTDDPAPFDRFALLCIRRHLATEFKVSFQNKRKVLNSSLSLDQESNGEDGTLSLIDIVSSENVDILSIVESDEFFDNLEGLLIENLSRFEREVYALYGHKFSYEEIAEKINSKREKVHIDVKSIDNALSRIKSKAKSIFQQYIQAEKDF